jgi:predicted nucleic acid-binding protein
VTFICFAVSLRVNFLPLSEFPLCKVPGHPANSYHSLTEIHAKSRHELRIRKGVRLQWLQLIKNSSHLVVPSRRLDVCSDPDDNVFVECADKAGADYIVTGDSRHFPKFWKKTKIITVGEFVSLVAPHLIS